MKKRFLAMAMAAVLCLGLGGCGSGHEGGAKTADSGSKGPIKVAVVYAGNLGDKSYNDSCNAGTQRAAKDFGVEVKNLEGTTADEWEANLLACCEGGYDLVICSNSNFQEYLEKYKDSYPNVKFAIIDTRVKGPNVVSISFAQNQGSFLAGAVAAMFTTHSGIEGVNSDAIIGWVGGQDVPVLHDFYAGFEQGANYINPDITILQSFAGTWIDPLKGKELTLAQYEQGADIVMNVASGTGTGVLAAAKEAGKYAIGVDLNQDNDQPGHVVTSMVKRVDTACYDVISSVADGGFKGNATTYLEVSNDGVDLTDFSVIKERLGDQFPAEIPDKVQELKDKIISGEIVVNHYEGFGNAQ